MKFSFMVISHEVSKKQVTGLRGDYDDLFKNIRETGFSGVEVMLRNPFEADFAGLARAAEKYGLAVPMFCTGEFYGEDSVSFTDPDPAVRNEAKRRFTKLLEAAAVFGANVNIGRLRGFLGTGTERENRIKWLQETLREAAEGCPAVKILIEPIYRRYIDNIFTTREGLAFIEKLDCDNVRLMLDIDHMMNEKEDIAQSIQEAWGKFHHVHICDTDHLPLGKGSYDFGIMLKALKERGYQGFVSVEAFSSGNPLLDLQESYAILTR